MALVCLTLITALGGIVARSTADNTAASNQLFLPLVTLASLVNVTPLGDGFSQVTVITNAGDDRLFIGQRTGEIYTLEPDGSKSMYLDLSSVVISNGTEYGLYDLAFAPDFATSGLLYVTYSDEVGTSVYQTLSRLRVKPGEATPDMATLAQLVLIPQDTEVHKGGGLDFDKRNGLLYMGVGDDTDLDLPQDPASPKGKVLRIDVSGVPLEATGNATPYVTVAQWSFGFRNPWRLDVDETTDQIYVTDVGSGSWEEINVGPVGTIGGNYGWPCFEGPEPFGGGYGVEVCRTGIDSISPLFAYDHEDGRCAIIGGSVYRPTSNPADGRFIFGDLCTQQIFALSTGGAPANPNLALGTVSRYALLTIGDDAAGSLIVGDSNLSGPVLKLSFPTP